VTADEIKALAKAVAHELAELDRHPLVMTVQEASDYIGRNDGKDRRHIIRDAIAAGEIPLMRGGRKLLIARVAVDAWMAGESKRPVVAA
jgi:excisionase family DNA binding protein